MHQSTCRLTVCILFDPLPSAPLCLMRVLNNAPPESIELRLGFNQEPQACYHALGLLVPDGATPICHVLPHGMERYHWTANDRLRVWAWHSSARLAREQMLRQMFHDVPLETEYVVCVDPDYLVEPGWWESLAHQLENRMDYIGSPRWHDYQRGQLEAIQSQPWYMGIPADKREGRLGVSFMAGEFLILNAACLREANFPDPSYCRIGDQVPPYPCHVLLGEIARQLGWSQAALRQHVK